jgi:hypothetical protein
MRNLSKKLAVLTLAACGFGLTQTTLAGDRTTVIHVNDHHTPYSMRGHYDHPKTLYRDHTPYANFHRHSHHHRVCRDYSHPYRHGPRHYDSHGHGHDKTDSGWHAHSDAGPSRHTDHRDRHVTNTAYAKGYRY